MKFKQLAILIAFLLCCTCSFSQDSIRHWQVELRPGVGIPFGDFGNKKFRMNPPDIKLNGLAKTGISANLAVSYALKKNVGVSIIAGFSSNKQDGDAFKTGPNASGDPYEEDVKTNSWNIARVMAGGWLQTSTAKHPLLSLRFRLAAGVCQASSPAFRYTRIDNPDDQSTRSIFSYWQDKIKLKTSFCYEAGLQLIHQVSTPFSVSLGTSLFQSTLKDRQEFYISPTQYSRRKWDYNVSILAIDLGVHYSF